MKLLKMSLLVLLSVFVFAYCSSSEDDTKNDDTKQVTEDVSKTDESVNEEDVSGEVSGSDTAVNEETSSGLSDQEKEDLLYLREEEKLARDVYKTLYDKWGLNIFQNISESEQTHTDSVKKVLEDKGLTDPVTDDTVGVFKNEELATLYNDLVQKGEQSELDALKVGATIEDLDINDIQKMLSHTNDEELKTLYNSLMCGSRNHMRAFVSQIQNKGGTYEPQFISEEEFNQIISSDMEQCGSVQ